MPKTVAVDFDGVLNTYDGWRGELELFEPRDGAHTFLVELRALGFDIVIHTTRSAKLVKKWLEKHGMAELVEEVTDKKIPAVAYVDDRAIPFNGDYYPVVRQLGEGFQTHWEAERDREEVDPDGDS